jgi:putative ABC transport system permease protein
MLVEWNFWKRPDGGRVMTELVGLDESGVGGPWTMSAESPQVVHRPDAVIVDELYLDRLGVSGIGSDVEMQSRRAVVRGVSRDVRTFTASPLVFASLNAAKEYGAYRDAAVTYVLVRCAGDHDALEVQRAIQAEVPHVETLTSREFALRTMKYWLLQTGAGVTIVVTAVLGLFVGGVITSQSLFALTQSHLAEYAALLALGFRRRQLVAIVCLQGLLIGAWGAILGSAAFFYAARLAARTPFTLETTPLIFATLVSLCLTSCLLACVLSVRSIFRIDPTLVFPT